MNKSLHYILVFLCFAFAKANLAQATDIPSNKQQINASQSEFQKDSTVLRSIYDVSLLNGMSYQWLDELSNDVGSRLSGSAGAEKGVQWGKKAMEDAGFDKVWLQPVMVPHWVRGEKEIGSYNGNAVAICALGGSIATPAEGLNREVIEVQNFEDLKRYGREQIQGKIVFYNRPMQADLIQTFEAYGGCVNQRYAGAMEAAKYGAAAVIVRSMNLRIDEFPHTGSMSYGDLKDNERIPAAAISTKHAEELSSALKKNPETKFYIKQSSQNYADAQSYNVVGEIKGSEFPDEVIVVGGHLDSWDLGDGSHDDGAGVVQSMEVLRIFNQMNMRPRHTIRVVLWMNEENGLRGARKYAEISKENNEKHIFALESDAGGFTPRGFSFDCSDAFFEKVESWRELFKPYLIHFFEKGGSGADIGPLKEQGVPLAGLRPDSQRYFDHHHAENDTFDAVNKRELELGAASMAALVYLVDKYNE